MSPKLVENVAKVFVNHWVYRFGPPVQLHSDKGTQFESELLQSLCSLLGIRKTHTTPYHPQGNGALERFHRTLKTRLLTSAQNWVDSLPSALFAYRTVRHSGTCMSPFQLTYGFSPQIPSDWPTAFCRGPQSLVPTLREWWNNVVTKLGDPGSIRCRLKPGNLVLVRVPNAKKLDKPWTGPMKITRILGPQPSRWLVKEYTSTA